MSGSFFATGVVQVAKRDSLAWRARKEAQPQITRAAAAGGLASLGLLGAGVAAKRPGMLIRIPKDRAKIAAIRRHQATGKKLGEAATPVGLASAGVGGIGGLNSAGIQRHEAKQAKRARREFGKAREFNPEERRQRRNKRTSWGLGVGAGGAAAFGGVQGGRLVAASERERAASKIAWGARGRAYATANEYNAAAKAVRHEHRPPLMNQAAKAATRANSYAKRSNDMGVKAKATRKLAMKKGGVGLVAGAALGAAAVTNERRRRNHGKPYDAPFDMHPAVKRKVAERKETARKRHAELARQHAILARRKKS